MKVYKGTTLVVEYGLLDVPVAMSIIYTEVAMVGTVVWSNIIF